jgi:hypothetical protein
MDVAVWERGSLQVAGATTHKSGSSGSAGCWRIGLGEGKGYGHVSARRGFGLLTCN